MSAGQRSVGQRTAKPRGRSKQGTTESGSIREWAAAQGLDVFARGRVPKCRA
ncbi:histone-like nucleoid-structuring protein Lsr2 [Microbacterium sp. M]|uniref:Lsr2 family DNA-binding protein n=1 Tax=Microbacterium sp. M TaxID=3377125 RepID=UPI003867FCA0